MTQLGYLVLGLVLGAALGAVVFGTWRRSAATPSTRVEARLEVQAAELRRLADASAAREGSAEHLRSEFAGARRVLESLALREDERRVRDAESWEIVRRLSTVLVGSASKGRAGENVLREHLAQLPPGMLVTDLRVNGRVAGGDTYSDYQDGWRGFISPSITWKPDESTKLTILATRVR